MKYIKTVLPYIIIVLVVVIIRIFIVTPVIVNGSSMYPTLKDKQLLILNKYKRTYKRFDIVVLKVDEEKLIKRVIGLPGEYVEYKDGKLFIDGKEVNDPKAKITGDFSMEEDLNETKIPQNTYLVLGDNRTVSIDSRVFGLVSSSKISGTTTLRLYPFNVFGKIEKAYK